VKRKLRLIVGEFFRETGEVVIEVGAGIRDFGWFILPDREGHPAFLSNDELRRRRPHPYRIPTRPR
jgi:hypothetical protein